jgi:Gpi18-like mannosyltransferase
MMIVNGQARRKAFGLIWFLSYKGLRLTAMARLLQKITLNFKGVLSTSKTIRQSAGGSMSSLKTRFERVSASLPLALDNLIFLIVGLIISLVLRIKLFRINSIDYDWFLSPWYDYIVGHGGFRALKDDFSNYTPPYLYLLTLATYLPIPKMHAIKWTSVVFDFVLAALVALIVRLKYRSTTLSMVAFFITLFTPTVFFNSALWGQCDAMYTSALLASLYLIIKRRPVPSVIFLGVALTFKLQSVFLFPLFLILWLKKEIQTRVFLLIPAVYVLMVLPAWLMGRPFVDLLLIHVRHAGVYNQLTLNAPNLYQWVAYHREIEKASLFFAMAVIFLFCYVVYQSRVEFEKNIIIKLATASAILIPYVLPHMHERYFFPADVLSIIYAFYFPRFFFIPILVISASFFSYLPVIFFNDLKPVLIPYMAVLMALALIVTMVDLVRTLYPGLRGESLDLEGLSKRLPD